MTTQIDLIWRGEYLDSGPIDAETLHLYGGADGFRLREDGWLRAVGAYNADRVRETMTLSLEAADTDDLAALVQLLALWQKRIARSTDTVIARGVWLRVKMDSESSASQAPLFSLDYEPAEDFLTNAGSYITKLVVTFERGPWESVTWSSTVQKTGLASLGGMAQLSETIRGDMPARLPMIGVETADNLRRIWIGFRSSDYGTPANFVPVWPLHLVNSGARSADTTPASDSDAYDGTRLTCDFSSTADLAQRVLIQAQDVSAHTSDLLGHFAVLLRARMSAAASEAHVRIGFGFGNRSTYTLANPVWRPLQRVTSTSYRLLEMRSIMIPPDEIFQSFTNFSISIAARRVSGSGALQIDCLGLVPLDEGMLKVVTDEDLHGSTNANVLRVSQSPGGRVAGHVIQGSYGMPLREVTGKAEVDPIAWGLPAADAAPSVVTFAERATVSTKTDTLSFNYFAIPRWKLLRGGE
jgi:hypothetical protein